MINCVHSSVFILLNKVNQTVKCDAKLNATFLRPPYRIVSAASWEKIYSDLCSDGAQQENIFSINYPSI